MRKRPIKERALTSTCSLINIFDRAIFKVTSVLNYWVKRRFLWNVDNGSDISVGKSFGMVTNHDTSPLLKVLVRSAFYVYLDLPSFTALATGPSSTFKKMPRTLLDFALIHSPWSKTCRNHYFIGIKIFLFMGSQE